MREALWVIIVNGRVWHIAADKGMHVHGTLASVLRLGGLMAAWLGRGVFPRHSALMRKQMSANAIGTDIIKS